MPTKARQHQLQDNICYHIINRGNRRLKIFHDHEDYTTFKMILERYTSEKEMILYHYSLIPNHYHLECEIPIPERISSVIGGINRAYSHYYHKRYKTAGYLWQGRFLSRPVEKEEYSLWCGAYIEMNPVRAKMTTFPEEYQYSSAKYYILGEEDDILTEDPNFSRFGNTITERQINYRDFLLSDSNNKDSLVAKKVIGSKKFQNKLRKKSGRWLPRRKGIPGFVL